MCHSAKETGQQKKVGLGLGLGLEVTGNQGWWTKFEKGARQYSGIHKIGGQQLSANYVKRL